MNSEQTPAHIRNTIVLNGQDIPKHIPGTLLREISKVRLCQYLKWESLPKMYGLFACPG